jgi:copper chaperone CopZ
MKRNNVNDTVKIKLKVEGLDCSSCALSIDFDLEDVDGVISAKTNYAKQETEVEFDENKVSLKQILDTFKKIGYIADIL